MFQHAWIMFTVKWFKKLNIMSKIQKFINLQDPSHICQSLGFMNSLFVFLEGWLIEGLSDSKLAPTDDLFLLVKNFLATVPTKLSYL